MGNCCVTPLTEGSGKDRPKKHKENPYTVVMRTIVEVVQVSISLLIWRGGERRFGVGRLAVGSCSGTAERSVRCGCAVELSCSFSARISMHFL
jgi:hypothetical protein